MGALDLTWQNLRDPEAQNMAKLTYEHCFRMYLLHINNLRLVPRAMVYIMKRQIYLSDFSSPPSLEFHKYWHKKLSR